MRLKRLELVGFKSFANRVALEFGAGITAIVGPNGAGKSNISDAVRWVLGEQSIKSIRGAKLEDVIFAGSSGKKPLGMAEVQLTLDNSDGFLPIDFSEVTITRRVYRSGESEFMINRQPCRLRDIQDLFTDTGLGREGYAIIGQGQVDAILSVNPLDRRFVLEETAGIIKYRQRKEQAQKKLAQTEYDLVRVSDILAELNEQLAPLEVQAKKAREYQQLSAQLDKVVLDKVALKLRDLTDQRQHHSEVLEASNRDAETLSAEYESIDQAISADQEQLSILEHALDRRQQELSELNEQLNQVMQTIGLIDERLANNQINQEQRAKAKDAYLAENERLQLKLEDINRELALKQNQYGQLEQQLAAADQMLNEQRALLQQKREQLEKDKSAFIEFVSELAAARNSGMSFEQQMHQLKQQVQFTVEESRQLEQELDTLSSTQCELSLRIDQLQRQEKEADQQLMVLNQEWQEIETDLAKTTQAERTCAERLQRTKSRLQALMEFEKEYEGYSHSVRRLMQARHNDFEILGTVADVIRVAPGLETAIEVALGPALQYLITPGETDAKLAIEWLKEHQAGRCTFLPLDNVRGSEFPEDYRRFWEDADCLGPAMELIEFDAKFTPALAALLGRVAVVKDLDAALRLQRRLKSFSRIVTLSGEVVMPNGSLTGGSISQKSSGLLARKNEIFRLEQEQAELEAELSLHVKAKADLETALEHNREQQEQLKALLYQVRLDIQAAEAESSKLANEQKRLSQLLDARRKQVANFQLTMKELEDQAAAAGDTVAAMEQEEGVRRDRIRQLEMAIAALDQELQAAAAGFTDQKVALTSAAAEVRRIEEQQRVLVSQMRANEAGIAEVEKAIAELLTQRKQLQQDLAKYQEQQAQLRVERERIISDITAGKEARSGLQERIKQYGQQMKSLQSRLARIDKKIYNHRLELDRIDLELRRIDEDLKERELDRSGLAGREVAVGLEELLAEEISLKNAIRELGLVNLAALQDYETVKERVFFLQTQYEDLIKAKETLYETITEIDATSAERLLDTYRKLRQEFQAMFGQLFKGGQADLELTDPGNILESGLEIVAQPPGKKPQNLLLLSGGERALTAIALLLAIRKVKPTPFVILDEIDASLDEINLKRFAEQMRFLAEATQFLVITHRPSIMEAADRLYGVTMGDDATSQLISVQLSYE